MERRIRLSRSRKGGIREKKVGGEGRQKKNNRWN